MNKPYNFLFKYIIVGDTSVGKSCLLLQYVDRNFRQNHEATIGVEFGAKQIVIKGKTIKIQLWDTAGQESFRSITRSYYRGSIGALLVYDISRRESFQNAISWINEIRNYGNEKMVICLVGNKLDLEDNRQVSEEEGKELAKRFGMQFFEVSAKLNQNVDQVFTRISEQVYKKIERNEIDLTNEKYGVKIGQKADIEIQVKKEEQKQGCC
ncbi:hypothetical protein pb186bvf_008508 [Paramecium bursaria]